MMKTTPLTQADWDRIRYLIENECKPEACVHIVGNRAEGYHIQAKGMVMHPADFLDIFDGDDAVDVVVDILKNAEKEG